MVAYAPVVYIVTDTDMKYLVMYIITACLLHSVAPPADHLIMAEILAHEAKLPSLPPGMGLPAVDRDVEATHYSSSSSSEDEGTLQVRGFGY